MASNSGFVETNQVPANEPAISKREREIAREFNIKLRSPN